MGILLDKLENPFCLKWERSLFVPNKINRKVGSSGLLWIFSFFIFLCGMRLLCISPRAKWLPWCAGGLEEKWSKDQKVFALLRRIFCFILEGTAFLGTLHMYVSLARSIPVVTFTVMGSWRFFSFQASLGGCGKGLLNEPAYSNCQNINVSTSSYKWYRRTWLKRGQMTMSSWNHLEKSVWRSNEKSCNWHFFDIATHSPGSGSTGPAVD